MFSTFKGMNSRNKHKEIYFSIYASTRAGGQTDTQSQSPRTFRSVWILEKMKKSVEFTTPPNTFNNIKDVNVCSDKKVYKREISEQRKLK